MFSFFRPKKIKVRRLSDKDILPVRVHPYDAGLDLYNPGDSIVLAPGDRQLVGTGIIVEIPAGYTGIITGRSSLNFIGLNCAVGIIDSGYTSELKVILTNNTGRIYTIGALDRIAQLLIVPVFLPQIQETTAPMDKTSRGDGGFGSSGV